MNYTNFTKAQLLEELKKCSNIDNCYHASVESAPWGIIIHDQKGETLVFNAQMQKITGFTKDEMPDLQSWLDLIHSDKNNHRKILDELKAIPLKEKQQEWEATITCKDGKKRSCLLCANLMPLGYRTVFVTDLTEKKQARNFLLESEERYQSLFNILPYGGEIIDTTGKIINCSLRTAQMLGYTKAELIGKKITELLDPDSLETFQRKMPLLLTGEFVTAEICMVHKDGSLLHIQRAANPILDTNGKVEAILAVNVDITNFKLSEKELRIERDNLKIIFEAMEDGVFISNQQFEIQYMNPVLTNEFGPYEGRKCYEYFNSLTAPCSWCQNSKVFAGETVRWEWTSPRNHKTYDLIDTPIKNPDGSISKLEIIRDISELKQAAKTIKESEERYRSIFDNNQSVMLLIDPETAVIVDANPAAVSFYGWSHQKLTGKKITEINMLSKEEVFQAIEDAIQNDRKSFEFSHRLANGEIKEVEVFSNSIKVNEELLLFSVVHDITERKEARKVLEQKEKVNDTLINSMPYPIMLINKDRIVLAANKMARDIGAKVDQHCWREFGHCEFLSEEDKIRARENPSDPGIQCTYCQVDKMFSTNEQQFDPGVQAFNKLWEIYWIPISENEFLHYTIDISERKHAENILLKTSRMEATATLAAGVAHDFNNLMVGVLGYSELLKSRFEIQSYDSDMLDTIGSCARKASDLAQQLLAYARGGKYQVKIINLNETIQETLRLNERSFPPRIRIERDYEPELLNVNADSAQMSQVVTNLCINAVEAIEKTGRIIITTRNVVLDEKFTNLHATLQPGHYVYLSVEDTGSGMDTAIIDKIFEPFFSTKFQGRGLGLAAVYGIVKNHDGFISAYSEVGMGAIFKIYLPVVEMPSIPEPQPQPTDLSGNETILVIDDEKMVLDVTRRILEISGYHVLLANDGQDAVEIAHSYEGVIHLAILDMSMPILGGPETYPLIKKVRPDIKVIISSGFELDASAQSLLDAGAETFIQKPFRNETLTKVVRRVFDG